VGRDAVHDRIQDVGQDKREDEGCQNRSGRVQDPEQEEDGGRTQQQRVPLPSSERVEQRHEKPEQVEGVQYSAKAIEEESDDEYECRALHALPEARCLI
jgi:hypothetical protein